ncbi:MAG: hypothetical protein WCC95_00320, partial [Candidatus Sulfotelmatobacter sp.]
MPISKLVVCFLLALPVAAFGPVPAENAATPQLDHFNPDLVDRSLNPCDDFYKYACSKWIAANPIPSDEVYWSTGSGLEMWNDAVLRETLEAASKDDPNRTP